MKQIFKLNDDGNIIIYLRNNEQKECNNIHTAILYARRKWLTMSNGYYEYRLKEITEILGSGIEQANPEIAEILKKERKKLLHELRHTESLPSEID